MESISPTLLIITFALGAGSLLWQWQLLRRYHKEREVFLSSTTLEQGPHKRFDPLYAEAPFPLLAVKKSGEVLWCNHAFWTLLGDNQLQTLAELDARLGTNLADLPKNKVAAHHLSLSLHTPHQDSSQRHRLFTVVTWPHLHGRTQATVLCFFEQTAVRYRRLHTSGFESQIILYLSNLSKQMEHIAQAPHGSRQNSLVQLSAENKVLVDYLQTMHQPVRRQLHHERVNLTTLCKEALRNAQEIARSRRIHIINTLPHACEAFTQKEDCAAALQLTIDAILELAQENMTLRVHVTKQESHIALNLHIPELILEKETVAQLFHFGTSPRHPLPRMHRLKLALAQQIMVKYHGHLHAVSEPQFGTVIELIFANGEVATED